jgi:hypothetical protein
MGKARESRAYGSGSLIQSTTPSLVSPGEGFFRKEKCMITIQDGPKIIKCRLVQEMARYILVRSPEGQLILCDTADRDALPCAFAWGEQDCFEQLGDQ